MMEPIAGFYILMGLLFDVIGAILIASTVIAYKTNWTPLLLEQNKRFTDFAIRFIPTPQEIGSGIFSKERLLEMKENNEKVDKSAKDYERKLDKEIKKQEKEFSKNRAFSGLSFFIGGFSLQGIGVVIQLF